MNHLNSKNFSCTAPIHIGQYFKKFSEEVKIFDSFNLDPECSEGSVVKICSIDKLSHPGEVEQLQKKSNLSSSIDFKSNGSSSHLQIQRTKNNWSKYIDPKQALSYPPEENPDEFIVEEEDLTPDKDVLLIVRLYKPFQYDRKCKLSRSYLKYTHEFAILGTQTLADLRDQFKCTRDIGHSVELQHPDHVTHSDLKEEYPSGFIFIENCCYNDMRHPNAIDYSSEVVSWAKRKGLPDITTAEMENTKLEDLTLRIGYPYVYQHQANCEHLVVFTDARLLRHNDLLASARYPYVLSQNRFNRIMCIMCRRKLARFLITDSDRLLAKNNHLCKRCVLAYNYKNGEKIGSFKLYTFFDQSLLNSYAG